jgi:hypothetical protein
LRRYTIRPTTTSGSSSPDPAVHPIPVMMITVKPSNAFADLERRSLPSRKK